MSDNILIPPEVLAAHAKRERQAALDRAANSRASAAERFRAAVRSAITDLDAELGNFEQTTHGSLRASGTVQQLAKSLVAAYLNPTAFNISELSQSIEAFNRVESGKPVDEMRAVRHTFTDSAIALAKSVLDGNHEAARALADEVFEFAKEIP